MYKSRFARYTIAVIASIGFYAMGVLTCDMYLSEKIREHDQTVDVIHKILDDTASWHNFARLDALQARIDTVEAVKRSADKGRLIDSALADLAEALTQELETLEKDKDAFSKPSHQRQLNVKAQLAQDLIEDIEWSYGR